MQLPLLRYTHPQTSIDWCPRFEVPIPIAATSCWELQIEKRHQKYRFAGALLFPKFVSEGAARYDELRKTGHQAMKRKPSTEATAAWIRLMRIQSRVLDAVEQNLKKAGCPPLAWYV